MKSQLILAQNSKVDLTSKNIRGNKTINNRPLSTLFIETIPMAMQRIRNEMRVYRSEDLSIAQFRILANLRRGSKTLKDLAETIGVSVAASSRMVAGLHERGLLEQKCSDSDRREKNIQLTAKGSRILEATITAVQQIFALKMAKLSARDQQILAAGLLIMQKLE